MLLSGGLRRRNEHMSENNIGEQGKNVASCCRNAIRSIVKDVILGIILPFVYFCAAKRSLACNKVVFLESKQEKMPDSFETLYCALEECGDYKLLYISLGQHRVPRFTYFVHCVHALREIATAEYVFLNDASDVISCVNLRDQTKVVQLWHACGAFKKWGMSTADLKFGGTREQILRHPFYKNLSLVTVSSPEVVWAYAEAMGLEKQRDIIKPLGVSRTDVFFSEAFILRARAHVQDLFPQTKNKKVILYAPTFRGRVSKASGPDRLDIDGLRKTLSKDYVLLIKHHPFVRDHPAVPKDCDGFAFDVSGAIEIEDLLCVADVCITDYSSIVFEYSLFERPMLFFAYDKGDYDDWRGFYYNYEEFVPGPIFENNEDLIEYLMHLDERYDGEKVTKFRQRFMSSCDGHATDRIVREVFGTDKNGFS